VKMEATICPKSQYLFKNPCEITAIYSGNNTSNIPINCKDNEEPIICRQATNTSLCGLRGLM